MQGPRKPLGVPHHHRHAPGHCRPGIPGPERPTYDGIIGTFTPEPGSSYDDYTVNILWGDGSQLTGTIDFFNNISGSHTYNAAGDYPVAFQVVNTLDNTAMALPFALIENPTDGPPNCRYSVPATCPKQT